VISSFFYFCADRQTDKQTDTQTDTWTPPNTKPTSHSTAGQQVIFLKFGARLLNLWPPGFAHVSWRYGGDIRNATVGDGTQLQ